MATKTAEAMPAPTPGRIMLYRYSAGDGCAEDVVGEQRPAIVVCREPHVAGLFYAQVLTAGAIDFPSGCPGGGWALHCVTARLGDGLGQLSWPPRA